MTLEKGSLILLDYTAKIKDTNEIFETTRADDVKNNPDYDPNKKYEPRLLGVGEGWVLKGLDEALLESSIDTPLNIEIPPDKAFGERDPSKVRMIPLRKLGEKANEVSIGDVIELDDRIGIIRFIGSGRVQVDFNHKYAGRTLVYSANIIKKLEDDNEKISNLIRRRDRGKGRFGQVLEQRGQEEQRHDGHRRDEQPGHLRARPPPAFTAVLDRLPFTTIPLARPEPMFAAPSPSSSRLASIS